jgi:23S rRNA (guanosine2251-2'-O)-methyltransferase
VTPGLGGEQIEGRRAVRELLVANRRPVRELWIGEGQDPGQDQAGGLGDIAALAANRGVPVRTVPRDRLIATAKTDAPQGVLAFARPLPAASLEELVKARPGLANPFLLLLDGVTDPGNVGALLRTAECAGATGAVLPRHRAAHVTPAVAKAAAGAIEHLPIAVVAGIASALRTLASADVWTVGLDPDARASLWELGLASEPIALVLGAEGRGLSRLVRERCDSLVAIPQKGATASLNVAAAGALACFEVARRRE